ncbi:MAG: UDP-N-acetylmuramoyl-L-alanyl-D-glutamate--2,6-diaminopimelate ligase [Pelosinus sp.]|nr:UDP-N-acetylmuramoyl-L-alanyl-D-glutamate--2,6-diaminopimelate ligase [Pelosinus sp.]
MAKTLKDLLTVLPEAEVLGGMLDQKIEYMTFDSRKVQPGTLFICLPGAKVDGHDYINAAYQAGAVAVLMQKEVFVPEGMAIIKVPDTRSAMCSVAPYFFDYPSRKLRMIGITGTNGKTTTTYLIKSILKEAGYKTGIIGTIQTMIGEKILPIKNTTPDAVDLQEILAKMVIDGIEYVVMEVSSHALALNRVAGCEFDVGIFTNLTQDHLDFHHNFTNYLAAKAKLFAMLKSSSAVKQGKTAVVNIDDAASTKILQSTNCPVITYGINKKADLEALDPDVHAGGTSFTVRASFGEVPLSLKITGLFNVYNVLAAIGAAQAENIAPQIIKAALEKFQSVPGRFELVDAGQSFSVIVDYAHTPDGLENILKTARQIAKQRIIVVFGCGGDRDRTKRPIMGKLAAQYGDVVIATSDNPRSEDPAAILEEVEAGILKGLTKEKDYEKIIDRRQAITRAITLARPEDVVIIAGKGHENYQILKEGTIAFDDREVAREIIRGME